MYATIPTEYTKAAPIRPLTLIAAARPVTRLKAWSYFYHEGDQVDWLYQITFCVCRLACFLAAGCWQVVAFGYPVNIVGIPSESTDHGDCRPALDKGANRAQFLNVIQARLRHWKMELFDLMNAHLPDHAQDFLDCLSIAPDDQNRSH